MKKTIARLILPKIYVFVEPYRQHLAARALSEDGVFLAFELVKSEAEGRKFLLAVDYMVNDPFGHRKVYDRHYPRGYVVEYVPLRDKEFHKGLRYAQRLNRKREN